MANPVRRERVAEQIHKELGILIQSEVRDPRLGWSTVTHVEMSPDLAYAKVYVSVLGDEAVQKTSLQVLHRARSFLRGQLGRRVRLRTVPELQFRLDHGFEHSQRIMDILNAEREAGDTGDAGGTGDAGDAGGTGDAGDTGDTGDAGRARPNDDPGDDAADTDQDERS